MTLNFHFSCLAWFIADVLFLWRDMKMILAMNLRIPPKGPVRWHFTSITVTLRTVGNMHKRLDCGWLGGSGWLEAALHGAALFPAVILSGLSITCLVRILHRQALSSELAIMLIVAFRNGSRYWLSLKKPPSQVKENLKQGEPCIFR